MAMVRVWNITDDTNPDVKPHNRMVLGKVVKPGRAVQVDSERLARAHKVHRDVAAGFLYIGPRPPESYQRVKNPPRVVADSRRVGADGRPEGGSPKPAPRARPPIPKPVKAEEKAEAKEEKAELKAADAVEVKDSVSVELKPAEEAPKEESTEETPDETKSGGKKRKR